MKRGTPTSNKYSSRLPLRNASALALVLFISSAGFAAEVEVAPDTLESALANAAADDVLVLADGDYGTLSLQGRTGPTLAAATEGGAHFDQITVRSSSAVTLRGVAVSGESTSYLIDLDGDNEGVTVADCYLESAPDTSAWSAQDWIDRASGGISVDGTNMTITRNVIRNVGYAISVGADRSLVEGNLIENFSRDGLRGLGDYTVFQYNTVKNAYAVDDHHDDGFQSWSVGDDGVGTGEVTGIVLRGNTIINFEDPNQPHAGALQGIGCFDGTFVDWIVENNVVVTNHWHGITLLGARGCVVRNNTVLDVDEETPGPPWISVDAHKDGTPPEGCIVANNLTTDLSNADSVAEVGNVTFSMAERDEHFVDASGFDLHLLESSAAVDAADGSQSAPETDRDRISRPQGSAHDVGAYEWHDGTVMPNVGGSGATPESSRGDASSSGGGGDGSGATSASGGASGGSGSPGNGASNANEGEDAGPDPSDTTALGGCGCRTPRSPRGPHASLLSALVLIVLAGARRRLRPLPRHGTSRDITSKSVEYPSNS